MKKTLYFFDTNAMMNLVAIFEVEKLKEFKSELYVSQTVVDEFKKNHFQISDRYENINNDSIRSKFDDIINLNKNSFFYDYVLDENITDLMMKLEEKTSKVEKLKNEFMNQSKDFNDAVKKLKKNKQTYIIENQQEIIDCFQKENGFSLEQKIDLINISEKRFKYGIPPGYKDNKKNGLTKFNDVYIWFEFIEICKKNSTYKNYVFVTNDKKEHTKENIKHLKQEFKEKTGKNVNIMNIQNFLESELPNDASKEEFNSKFVDLSNFIENLNKFKHIGFAMQSAFEQNQKITEMAEEYYKTEKTRQQFITEVIKNNQIYQTDFSTFDISNLTHSSSHEDE
jgi:hypothetical protein